MYWVSFIKDIFGVVGVIFKTLAVPFFAYLKGVEDQKSKQIKKQYEELVKENETKKTNAAKSDSDILNELLRDSSRKDP